jgi:N-methylhydantoinase B
MKIDPITLAVIKNALDAIVDEMAYTVIRTARSEIIKDVMDYSAALCDHRGRMIAQAKTIALHLGAVPEAMDAVLQRYGNDLHPGDAVILNDPYHGGMHLPDIFMFFPIFHGGKLQGFCVVICHHTDVGGRVAGSNASDSTEIYQEGIRIPVIKLYSRGRIDETLERLIAINVRLPERVLGDLKAQYAACQIGARELCRLIDRHGAGNVRAYTAELLDYAERLTRAEIRTWPKGTFRFVDHIDDDGLSDRPIPIAVAVTVHDDRVTVDFAGSSPQVAAALNSTKSYTNSCTYLSVRCVLKGDIPNNAGVFRCIDVKAPEGSVLNPLLPAACAARALTGYRVMDAMFGALAQIVPDRVPAAGEGGNTVVCLAGYRADRTPFIIVDMICGCWGGRPDQDGIEAITNPSQNLSNTPVEVMEAQHPVRIEEYALIPDSCGAGKWRGGLGIARSYRVLSDQANLQLRSDRMRFPPYGLDGGEPGSPTNNTLADAGQPHDLASKVTMRLNHGQLIRHEQAGGGGFGDPLERDPPRVAADVWNRKISADYARHYHGVVVDPASGRIDESATTLLRAELQGHLRARRSNDGRVAAGTTPQETTP